MPHQLQETILAQSATTVLLVQETPFLALLDTTVRHKDFQLRLCNAKLRTTACPAHRQLRLLTTFRATCVHLGFIAPSVHSPLLDAPLERTTQLPELAL